MGALSFAVTHWRLIIGGLGALILGFYIVHLKGEVQHWQKEATRFESLYHAEQQAHALTVAGFRKATAEAQAKDAAHVIQVERAQTAISNERATTYESRLSDLRSRLDAERVRTRATAANPGSRGGAPVPQVPDAAGQPDESAATDREFNCAANSIQLEELQRWVRQQQAADSP